MTEGLFEGRVVINSDFIRLVGFLTLAKVKPDHVERTAPRFTGLYVIGRGT